VVYFSEKVTLETFKTTSETISFKKISGKLGLLLEKCNAGTMKEYSVLPEGKSTVIRPALLALWCWGKIFLEVPHADADVCSNPITRVNNSD